MTRVDDVELLVRARRGDERAFGLLFSRYQRAVHRYAVYMCGPEQSDDVVQDTFMAVLRQTRRKDVPRGSVIGYLLGIARHRILKLVAARGELLPVGDVDERVAVPTASCSMTVLDELTRDETIRAVRAAVKSLPAAYREVVVLCELEEMDYATAAEILRCPLGTVRSRLHRAKMLLSTKLAAQKPVAGAAGT